MIILAGHIKTDPALAEEFAQILRSNMAEVRREDGCLDYAMALDDKSEGKVLVYERWRDQASLDKHLSQPAIGELLGSWAERIEIHVRKFDATNERGFME